MVCLMMASCSGIHLGAKGPCDMPPYDPMLPVSSAEQARSMDRWAMKALRRDVRGRTCEEVREVVDILLVRWLQAHPDMIVAFGGQEAEAWMGDARVFLARIKAEALTVAKGQRPWWPRRWGKPDPGERVLLRRLRCTERLHGRFMDR